jgi:RNase adaptor protein for sRNA GlmZ degradation
MSGTGKSAALTALAARGHAVVDTDEPGWIIDSTRVLGAEPLWDLDRVAALVERHRAGWLFIAGCVANQGTMYDRMDAVVLLSAPVEVLLQRVTNRSNPFGSTPDDRAKIVADKDLYEPLLRAGATHEIDTRSPIASVVLDLERVADACAR